MPLQLNLSGNRLCGVWEEYDPDKGNVLRGAYAIEGILALCEAIEGAGSLTALDVRFNGIELVGRPMQVNVFDTSTSPGGMQNQKAERAQEQQPRAVALR